ncbi:Methyltransferase domain-containing protein [Rhodovastum atsumiense]|uniref:Methyltransferase domain-containing protein n=1 Tax=Rhodovastum atsumiense TaxID=504468 RepID=A0A5M6IKL5_9PROT|nr:rhodoquinone biosynthesis methyltransferase RquA [Rhodovastum atsumiense]KAA5608796.1 methyltransferase domain-containing protein [Rhodovastum atsumiense]CAH2600872.1 Methyltransferase domain-containing protein [Rhodovastum atsumiense]
MGSYSPGVARGVAGLSAGSANASVADAGGAEHHIPDYLNEIYWWTYIHPRAIRFFERPWLVNLILWGKYVTMRDAAVAELGETLPGRTLQIACVYGDLTPRLAARVPEGSQLDVLDVVPGQLRNLRRKLPENAPVKLLEMDSSAMHLPDATYDRALLFFLLHEMPVPVREATLREALRVVRPGGKLVIVDFAKPSKWHPLKYLWHPVLTRLEPFAPDLWTHPVDTWLPASHRDKVTARASYFGGFYQKLVITV